MELVTIWQCPDVMHLGYFCDIPAKNVQPESSEEMSDKAKLVLKRAKEIFLNDFFLFLDELHDPVFPLANYPPYIHFAMTKKGKTS